MDGPRLSEQVRNDFRLGLRYWREQLLQLGDDGVELDELGEVAPALVFEQGKALDDALKHAEALGRLEVVPHRSVPPVDERQRRRVTLPHWRANPGLQTGDEQQCVGRALLAQRRV